MLEELDRIVLTADIESKGLKTGDVGTIVFVHRRGEAFEVEFLTLKGDTAAVATVLASQARPVTDRDVRHARHMDVTPEFLRRRSDTHAAL